MSRRNLQASLGGTCADNISRMPSSLAPSRSMSRRKGFKPSEAVLREPPMPSDLFDKIVYLLQDSPHRVASSPEQGRRAALSYCQYYRSKRWHLNVPMENEIKEAAVKAIEYIVRKQQALVEIINQKEKKMSKIKIDDIEYDSESLSAEANEQLSNLQFVDQELARLQAQAAVLQTARNSYASALKDALPKTKA